MFGKILVAVDGSEPASHDLEYAAQLAEEQGADLVIVTVIPPITGYVVADSEMDYYPRLEEDMEKYYVRGRGGLISWMLGSTSRGVVESCTVPVLVVKDQEYCEAK